MANQVPCGETRTYSNVSGKSEYVHLVAKNDCEFTAYLWILFPNGRFISKEVKTGDAFDQHVVLPAGGSVEYNCTLVQQRGEGCTFSCDVERTF